MTPLIATGIPDNVTLDSLDAVVADLTAKANAALLDGNALTVEKCSAVAAYFAGVRQLLNAGMTLDEIRAWERKVWKP